MCDMIGTTYICLGIFKIMDGLVQLLFSNYCREVARDFYNI